MLSHTLTLLSLLVLTLGYIPKSWSVCKLSDPDLNKCLKPAISSAIADLMTGNPQLGVKSLDPLVIKSMVIAKGSDAVSVNLELTDFTVENLKYIVINTVENDWKILTSKITLPKGIHVFGRYKADGKVLVLPIKGEGHIDIKLDNVVVNAKLVFDQKVVNKKSYYHVNHLDFDFDTSQMHIKLDGLFGGDRALGDNTNKFLNENWRLLLGELKKPIVQALSKEFEATTNQVFSKISKDEISPP